MSETLDFILSEGQQTFIAEALKCERSIVLLGEAGVGKSVAIRRLIEAANFQKKRCLVLAPTGVAALNVGGQTVHYAINMIRNDTYGPLDFILIDEASMVRADLLDTLERVLRTHYDYKKPFGGIPIILVGDPAQLAPVMVSGDEDSEKVKADYPSPYFFSAQSFAKIDWLFLELKQIFRQTDGHFTTMLNQIRLGNTKEAVRYLNENRFVPKGEKVKGIVLTPTNKAASEINQKKLKQIDEEEHVYEARWFGKFNYKEFPTEQILALKVGAKVMCVKNLYTPGGGLTLVNGDTGIIEDFEPGTVTFLCDRTQGSYKVPCAVWEKVEKTTTEDGDLVEEVVGSFKQFPFRLGWAVTIHKSQGATLQELTLDLRSPLFANGQAYVALSRAQSLEGLWLYGKLRNSDVMVDKRVVDFLQKGMRSDYIWREEQQRVAEEWEDAAFDS